MDAESYGVTLEFSDGAVGMVPLAHLFEHPKGLAAEILQGNMFAMCFLENGALARPEVQHGFTPSRTRRRRGLAPTDGPKIVFARAIG